MAHTSSVARGSNPSDYPWGPGRRGPAHSESPTPLVAPQRKSVDKLYPDVPQPVTAPPVTESPTPVPDKLSFGEKIPESASADDAKRLFDDRLREVQMQSYNLSLQQAENVLNHKATESKAEQAAASGQLRGKFSY